MKGEAFARLAFIRRERKKNRGGGERKDESSISRAAALRANRSAFDSNGHL